MCACYAPHIILGSACHTIRNHFILRTVSSVVLYYLYFTKKQTETQKGHNLPKITHYKVAGQGCKVGRTVTKEIDSEPVFRELIV